MHNYSRKTALNLEVPKRRAGGYQGARNSGLATKQSGNRTVTNDDGRTSLQLASVVSHSALVYGRGSSRRRSAVSY